MDGKVFERMANAEDPQRAARKVSAIVFWGARKLKLQCAFAGVANAGASKIFACYPCRILGNQRCIDTGIKLIGEFWNVIEVKHQKGISGSAMAISRMAS